MTENKIAEMAEVVRACGQIVLDAVRSDEMVDKKAGHANFVTTYDRKVQEVLHEGLMKILPEAKFIGEEDDLHEWTTEGIALIVDPIDGTTNFIKDYKLSTISVGVLCDGVPTAGIIYNPYLDEMFTALKGRGAFCNGKKISVSGHPLKEGLILFGTAPYYKELRERSFELLQIYFSRGMDVRRSGSAAWDLCCIAAGRAELFFEMHLQPWDYAAGTVIVEEAGGCVSNVDGEPLPWDNCSSVLATNRVIRENDEAVIR